MVICDVHSLARNGRKSSPSRGKETWLLILNEYMTSCRKRFRWMHRICGDRGQVSVPPDGAGWGPASPGNQAGSRGEALGHPPARCSVHSGLAIQVKTRNLVARAFQRPRRVGGSHPLSRLNKGRAPCGSRAGSPQDTRRGTGDGRATPTAAETGVPNLLGTAPSSRLSGTAPLCSGFSEPVPASELCPPAPSPLAPTRPTQPPRSGPTQTDSPREASPHTHLPRGGTLRPTPAPVPLGLAQCGRS